MPGTVDLELALGHTNEQEGSVGNKWRGLALYRESPGTHRDTPLLHCNSACASRVKTRRAKQGEMSAVQAAQEAVAGGLPRALEPIKTSSEGKEGEREGKREV